MFAFGFGFPPSSRFPHSTCVPYIHHHRHLATVAAAAAALQHKRLGFLLRSSFQEFYRLHRRGINDFWHERSLVTMSYAFVETLPDFLSGSISSCLCFFSGKESEKGFGDKGKSRFEAPSGNSSSKRLWTNALLAINVIAFVAQLATDGKLMLWGAKVNSLIDQGQLWRLVTSSFLHANVGHLLVNCYSLNSVGPAVENISGPGRFLTVYFASAIASSTMSYYFCKAPAVGASGAVFGLVGSFAMFVLRHKDLVRGAKEDLQQTAKVIALNMFIGLLSKGIDNWGHLGGLLGGASISWFLGPAWTYEYRLGNRKAVFVDRAPVFRLFNWKRMKH